MVNAELTTGADVPTKMAFVEEAAKVNIRFVAKGAEANTGKQEERDVTIKDARNKEDLKLDTAGFELIHHESKVTNFQDESQFQEIHVAEIQELLKKELGADKVSVFNHVFRRQQEGGGFQPVGIGAHIDFAPHYAKDLAAKHAPSTDYTYSRYALVNVWRTFSPPPQDWPLAVCDGRSVPEGSGIFNALVYLPELPDMSNVPPPDPTSPGGTIFKYDPNLKWYYYSNMGRDEALVFKIFDSNRKEGWRVPHAAFWNPAKDAHPRESIEVRTVCYFK